MKKFLKKHFSEFETKATFYSEIIILLLVFIASLLYVLETYELSQTHTYYVYIADYTIMVIFTLEAAIRFFFAKSKKSFFSSGYNWLDILAIVPFWFGITSFQIFRLLRFFKIFRYSNKYLDTDSNKENSSFVSGDNLEKIFIARIVFLIFCILFMASSFILTIEKGINPQINTFGDAFYFSLVTITTVGFGDVIPVTQLGKIITVFVIVSGLLVIPWNTGILIKHIVYSISKTKVLCPKCRLMYHDRDAKHCKNCGTRIYIEYKKFTPQVAPPSNTVENNDVKERHK